MNFELNPTQPATSTFATLAASTGASPTEGFAALLDRSATGAGPDQNIPTAEWAAVTPEPILKMVKDDLTTLPERASVEIASEKGDAISAKMEPPASLVSIAKADALVARLSPASQRLEEPTTPSEERPMPSVLAAPARFAASADFVRSERKAVRHERQQASDERTTESEADGTQHPGAPASESAAIAAAQISPSLTAALTPAGQSPSRPVSENTVSLASVPRTKASPLSAAKAKEGASQEALPVGELPEFNDATTTPVELPKRAVEARQRIAVPDSAELELPTILNALESLEAREASTQKAMPVRAAKIAEIALGLADPQPAPNPIAVQSGKPDIVATATQPTFDITPSEAPARGTVVERQLDLIRNEQWLGELAHDIASTTGDASRLSFRLMPHQLGRLEVDVSRSHNGLSLSIQTESDSAKAILSAAQPRLADEIRSQGIKLADTQMFSGDARQSPSQDGFTRPAPLIEAFISPNDTVDEPEPEQRNGRYA